MSAEQLDEVRAVPAAEVDNAERAAGRRDRVIDQLQAVELGGVTGREQVPMLSTELSEDVNADLDDAGSNCVPGASVEPSQCFLARQPLAIRAVGRHGVVRVADENDP